MYNLIIDYIDSQNKEELFFGQHICINSGELAKLLETYNPIKYKGVERFIFTVERLTND